MSARPMSSNAIPPIRRHNFSGSFKNSVAAARKARSSWPRRVAFCSRLIATHGDTSIGEMAGMLSRAWRCGRQADFENEK